MRVDFLADLPVARRLTPSVTFTEPLALASARLTACGRLELHRLAARAGALHRRRRRAWSTSGPAPWRPCSRRSASPSRVIACVHVTLTERPRLANAATEVLTGLLTPNHGACAGRRGRVGRLRRRGRRRRRGRAAVTVIWTVAVALAAAAIRDRQRRRVDPGRRVGVRRGLPLGREAAVAERPHVLSRSCAVRIARLRAELAPSAATVPDRGSAVDLDRRRPVGRRVADDDRDRRASSCRPCRRTPSPWRCRCPRVV